jgi:hypothetical protein
MESIQLNKKFSNRSKKLIISSSLISGIIVFLLYFFTNKRHQIDQLKINEEAIVISIIFIIVVLPLVLFLIPNEKVKKSNSQNLTLKRMAIKKRRSKTAKTSI